MLLPLLIYINDYIEKLPLQPVSPNEQSSKDLHKQQSDHNAFNKRKNERICKTLCRVFYNTL